MKIHKLLVLCAAMVAGVSASKAAVTVTFNLPFGGGLSSNLANAAGVATNGMTYGIIVDGSNNGFLSLGSYGNITSNLAANSSTALTTGGSATDDVLYIAGDKTSDSGQGGLALEGDFATPGGAGGVSGLSFAYTGSVSAGDAFELVWFDADGAHAGTMTNAAFVVPADSAVVSVDTAFVGVDPVRSANQTIPEASGALLGLVGAAALLRRRR